MIDQQPPTSTQSLRTNMKPIMFADKSIPKGLVANFKKFLTIKRGAVDLDDFSIRTNGQLQPDGISNSKSTKTLLDAQKQGQTQKIVSDIHKRLKILPKSRLDKFDESMNLFKNTDTYVEIKPFLKQLNLLNHQSYLQQVSHLARNIEIAQEYQAHTKFLEGLHERHEDPTDENEDESGESYLRLPRRFNHTDLLKSRLASKSVKENTLMTRIMDGIYENQSGGINASTTPKVSSSIASTSTSGVSLETKKRKSKQYNNAGETSEEPRRKYANNVKVPGEPTDDNNKFFENLSDYLEDALEDLSEQRENEKDLDIYTRIIEVNAKKIEELRLEQSKKSGLSQLDINTFFAATPLEEISVDPAKYSNVFREKADEVRKTLNKMNNDLFQKKWANAQVKRQMQRQKEKNTLLATFKKSSKEDIDLINPSQRMNQKILAHRKAVQGSNLSASEATAAAAYDLMEHSSRASLKSAKNSLYLTEVQLPSNNSASSPYLQHEEMNHSKASQKKQSIFGSINLPVISESRKSLELIQGKKPDSIEHSLNHKSQKKIESNSFHLPLVKESNEDDDQRFYTAESSASLKKMTKYLNANGIAGKHKSQTSFSMSEVNQSMQSSLASIQDDVESVKRVKGKGDFRSLKQSQTDAEMKRILDEIEEQHGQLQNKEVFRKKLKDLSEIIDKDIARLMQVEQVESIRGEGKASQILLNKYYSGSKLIPQSKVSKLSQMF